MTVILCSLTLLDAAFSEVRNNLKREPNSSPHQVQDAFVAAKSSAPKPRLTFKRTAADNTSPDKPAGRKARLDIPTTGVCNENDEGVNNESQMVISSE